MENKEWLVHYFIGIAVGFIIGFTWPDQPSNPVLMWDEGPDTVVRHTKEVSLQMMRFDILWFAEAKANLPKDSTQYLTIQY